MRLTGGFKKYQKNGFFFIFPHAGTVEENTRHIEVLLLFLSLRYGADLGRSRLVVFCFTSWENYRGKQCVMHNGFSLVTKYFIVQEFNKICTVWGTVLFLLLGFHVR